MPGRAVYDDPQAELERRREQTRQRVKRYRERRNATGNASLAPENGALPSMSSVTPPTPARHSVPPRRETTPLPPKGGSPLEPRRAPLAVPAKGVAQPNKSGAVIDLLRERGLCDVLEDADHKAIKATPLTPRQIVEAVQAVATGAWDNEWLRQNLTVQGVIRRYQGFVASQQPSPPRLRREVVQRVTHYASRRVERSIWDVADETERQAGG